MLLRLRQIRKSARIDLGYLCSTLAAREAEIELLGDDQPLASANDEMRAREVLQKRNLDADRFVAETRFLARRLVRLHAPVIQRGARVLQSFGFLTSDDVAKILGQAADAVGYQPCRMLQMPPDEPEPEVDHGQEPEPAPIPSLFNLGPVKKRWGSAIGASTLFDRVSR